MLAAPLASPQAPPPGYRESVASKAKVRSPKKAAEEAKANDVHHSNPMTPLAPGKVAARPSAVVTDAVLALDMAFGETVVVTGASLLLEVMKEDGTWPRQGNVTPTPSDASIDEAKEDSKSDDEGPQEVVIDGKNKAPPGRLSDRKRKPGKHKSNSPTYMPSPSSVSMTVNGEVSVGEVGLSNLGNTCYMNATIQALSHTPILRQYFTSKKYLKDVNTANPIGHGGRLAHAFGNLIGDLWTAKTGGHISPRSFKHIVAVLNNQFAGNEQHDAEELLTFLLAGLSEDLNRIVDKVRSGE